MELFVEIRRVSQFLLILCFESVNDSKSTHWLKCKPCQIRKGFSLHGQSKVQKEQPEIRLARERVPIHKTLWLRSFQGHERGQWLLRKNDSMGPGVCRNEGTLWGTRGPGSLSLWHVMTACLSLLFFFLLFLIVFFLSSYSLCSLCTNELWLVYQCRNIWWLSVILLHMKSHVIEYIVLHVIFISFQNQHVL